MSSVRTFVLFILIFKVYIAKLRENVVFLPPPWWFLLSDVIQRAGGVAGRGPKGGSRMAARRSADPRVLHGATSADVQLSQLEAGSPLFELGKS